MDKSKMTEYIKVNFPLTVEDFAAGNGEGMWVLVDKETKEAHDKDVSGGEWVGILSNDSIYFPGLRCGEVVRFEMRGEYRPVAIFDGFLSEKKHLTQEEKSLLIKVSPTQFAIREKKKKYIYIRAYGKMLELPPDFIEKEVCAARNSDAPESAVYRKFNGEWVTLDDITIARINQAIRNFAKEME